MLGSTTSRGLCVSWSVCVADPEDVSRLLDQADALLATAGNILGGHTALPARCRFRAAALFARSGLGGSSKRG